VTVELRVAWVAMIAPGSAEQMPRQKDDDSDEDHAQRHARATSQHLATDIADGN
jgi:hypothetical protein